MLKWKRSFVTICCIDGHLYVGVGVQEKRNYILMGMTKGKIG